MVKLSELSYRDRQRMVSDISCVMSGYNVDIESINEFWDMVVLGVEATKRA